MVGEYLLGSASTSHLGLAGSLVEIVVIMYPTSILTLSSLKTNLHVYALFKIFPMPKKLPLG